MERRCPNGDSAIRVCFIRSVRNVLYECVNLLLILFLALELFPIEVGLRTSVRCSLCRLITKKQSPLAPDFDRCMKCD